MKFAKKLKQVREMRKLTQSELAQKTGLQPSHISHFEQGRREPSLSNFVKLCTALRVGPGAMLCMGGESIHDMLTMDEIEFIHLVRNAIIARHKREIRAIKNWDKERSKGAP